MVDAEVAENAEQSPSQRTPRSRGPQRATTRGRRPSAVSRSIPREARATRRSFCFLRS